MGQTLWSGLQNRTTVPPLYACRKRRLKRRFTWKGIRGKTAPKPDECTVDERKKFGEDLEREKMRREMCLW